jgi:hypothetical protein
MLDTVTRIGHGLDQRDKHRHVLRPASRHHAVDRDRPHGGAAAVREQDAQLLVGVAVGVSQELLDARGGRRHDRQTVAPAVLVEEAVDLVRRALEDDLARLGLPARAFSGAAVNPALLRQYAGTVARSSSTVWTSTWPGTMATGRLGRPGPVAVVAAADEALT